MLQGELGNSGIPARTLAISWSWVVKRLWSGYWDSQGIMSWPRNKGWGYWEYKGLFWSLKDSLDMRKGWSGQRAEDSEREREQVTQGDAGLCGCVTHGGGWSHTGSQPVLLLHLHTLGCTHTMRGDTKARGRVALPPSGSYGNSRKSSVCDIILWEKMGETGKVGENKKTEK